LISLFPKPDMQEEMLTIIVAFEKRRTGRNRECLEYYSHWRASSESIGISGARKEQAIACHGASHFTIQQSIWPADCRLSDVSSKPWME
jgi:hypothetical protein